MKVSSGWDKMDYRLLSEISEHLLFDHHFIFREGRRLMVRSFNSM